MSAVATIHPAQAIEQQAQSGNWLVTAVQQALSAPVPNMDMLERLLSMQERITAKQNEDVYSESMALCQSEIEAVTANADNKQTRSRYATYDQLDRAVRPVYSKHGFSLSFGEAESPKPEHVRVTCTVRHRAGHKEHFWKDMPADGKGAKGGDVMTKTHAAGAAQSYGMRYLLKGIFNIAVAAADDDNDGNSAQKLLSVDQVTELTDLAREHHVTQKRCFTYISQMAGRAIQSFAEIPADKYQAVKAAIQSMGGTK